MVYTSRLVVVGKTGKDPFVGFVLASNSLPYREMESRESKNGKRIYVLPRKGHESDNLTHPDVDNYACVIGEPIPKISEMPRDITGSILQETLTKMKKYALVSFNGHMCKRCFANIADGMKPEIALDSTLFEFRGLPNDARVGAAAYIDEDAETGFIGINDIGRLEKRVRGWNLKEGLTKYICVTDTSNEVEAEIPFFASEDELARFISKEMVLGIEKVVAGGVCVLRDRKELRTGVYNNLTEEIDSWLNKQ